MVALKNARHEKYAQALAKGKTADQAYKTAGFKPHRGNASTLRAKQNILERVAEILGHAAEQTLVTIDTLTEELEEARKLGMQNPKGASAAVSAVMGKAKLHGLLVDKVENKVTLDGLAKRLLGSAIRPKEDNDARG